MAVPEPIWCDPPSQPRNPWALILAPCLDRPGEWAMVRRYDRTLQAQRAQKYLRRHEARIPAGLWEFAAAQIEPNVAGYGLWARWLGP